MNTVVRKEDLGEPGPALLAITNPQHRRFVEHYLLETFVNRNKNNHGAGAAAARKAGYGNPKTKPLHMANIAWRLLQNEKIAAAVSEGSARYYRSLYPKAVKAAENIIDDPTHKDHGRMVGAAIDRTIPLVAHQRIDVMHRSNEQDEVAEFREARDKLKLTREQLLQIFGGNGLSRLEALEAADNAQRARDAKVIEGEVIEIEPEQQGDEHGAR